MFKQPENVVVATISEQFPWHGKDFKIKVFSTQEKAEMWIHAQIDAIVAAYGLNRETAVDGWFVEIARDQTVQFNALEEDVL